MTIIEELVLYDHRWLSFRERRYLDRFGNTKSWAFVERRNNVAAAAAVARTATTGDLLLVLQTRVAFAGLVLEFPAGLIDPGESPGDAALRELAEETGYRGSVVSVSRASASSAGLTNETIYIVNVLADEEPSVAFNHSGSEEIAVVRVAPRELSSLSDRAESESWVLDAKLATWLAAFGAV